MQPQSIGLHILIQPVSGGEQFPAAEREAVHDAIRQSSILHDCPLQAMKVLPDHVHVLVLADAETQASMFIASLMDNITSVMKGSRHDFQLSEDIHVTLLPPWHVEILASFVRDQERFHQHKTVEEELDLVFRPNALPRGVN
ncbi:MAG: hypothetical protein EHM43_05640 [Ignavibacteriae bacterium]|nr:MAG: hypothetical protein EHM43_05640 [Ignavibacteriota bacterium]